MVLGGGRMEGWGCLHFEGGDVEGEKVASKSSGAGHAGVPCEWRRFGGTGDW